MSARDSLGIVYMLHPSRYYASSEKEMPSPIPVFISREWFILYEYDFIFRYKVCREKSRRYGAKKDCNYIFTLNTVEGTPGNPTPETGDIYISLGNSVKSPRHMKHNIVITSFALQVTRSISKLYLVIRSHVLSLNSPNTFSTLRLFKDIFDPIHFERPATNREPHEK